jgi:hypothetical protein
VLDDELRAGILCLAKMEMSQRKISQELGVSRKAVKAVINSGCWQVPQTERDRTLDSHQDRVVELFAVCKGNLVRVHDLLWDEGIEVGYSTLTSFARKRGIGERPKRRAGDYDFPAGKEMQHDTSPHDVKIGDEVLRLQCASLVLCYSRVVYAQLYRTWNRFTAKAFLARAFEFFGTVATECMLDNSTVIMIGGTGKYAVPAPEMAAFSKRYHFEFVAHELGDANRSARVERPFDFIERNFYPGRTFESIASANEQFENWCREKNAWKRKHHDYRSPLEFFEEELPFLTPLPTLRPEIYQLEERIVDLGAWINLNYKRYSVPEEFISQTVSVRSTVKRVKIYLRQRLIADHPSIAQSDAKFSRLPGHHNLDPDWKRRKEGAHRYPKSREEVLLEAQGEEFVNLLKLLRKKRGGRAACAIRKLHEIYLRFPTPVVRRAFARATRFHVTQVHRIERIVLQHLGEEELLRLPDPDELRDPPGSGEDTEDGEDQDQEIGDGEAKGEGQGASANGSTAGNKGANSRTCPE